MTLGDKIIEMLQAGYGIHIYWEPDLYGDKDSDYLVVCVSKKDKSMEFKFARAGFSISPADLILMALQDIKEGFEA